MDKQKERNAKMKRKKKNGKEGLHNLARDRSLVERLRVRKHTYTRFYPTGGFTYHVESSKIYQVARHLCFSSLSTVRSIRNSVIDRENITWDERNVILCRIISVKFRSILYSHFSIRWRAVQLSHRLSKSCVIRFLFSLNAREFISWVQLTIDDLWSF